MVRGFGDSRVFQGSKWMKLAITGIIMLASVTSEHETGTSSASPGLLCISDCATCPVICSPPHPPLLKSYSPPPSSSSLHLSPPEPYYTPRSPSGSDDTHCPPPLEFELFPPSPPRPTPSPPPPAQSSYSSKASPPPPRFVYFFNAPPGQGQGLPTGLGPHEYPYPYYYYPSKASPLSFQASLLLVMFFFTAVL
ncbi:extensin-like [Hibiscus syriacus]|uniref:extensin-like n=1 Tax=Hibiscus syriacus TaxID=106335 RepID=UPI0019228B7E|nr:extensin-like [Hibiscus syriacus]